MLHGEQYIEQFKEIPTHGKLRAYLKVVDILDKKSGALVVANGNSKLEFLSQSRHNYFKKCIPFSVDVFDMAKEKVLTTQWSLFVVGAGGFGGKRSSDHIVPPVDPPKRQPDASLQYKTSTDQVSILCVIRNYFLLIF